MAETKKTIQQQKPPDQDWQEMAREIIERCQSLLFTRAGEPGLDYLLSRGIASPTMERFNLGYSPAIWIGKVKIPQGIIIPAIVGGMCWYIKIRSLPKAKGPRYLCVPGSKTNAVFGADQVNGKPYALISEGEFNAMTLDQEIGEFMPICSLGSAVNKLDMLTWGRYFLSQKTVMCLFDNDSAGEKGFENMSEMLGDRTRRLPMPGNGDVNDFFVAGGDIETWFKPFWKELNGSKE
jgi:DNA primase